MNYPDTKPFSPASMSYPFVKICGITSFDSAQLACQLGVRALGFVFAPSKRRIKLEDARQIIQKLNSEGMLDTVETVAVFVNESPDNMKRILESTGIDMAQIHGDESPEECARFDFPWYKALRPRCALEAVTLLDQDWSCSRLLVDAFSALEYGGTGMRVTNDIARQAASVAHSKHKQFVLAGGLSPDNVVNVVTDINPDGIDISSGIEIDAGIKSSAKMMRLFDELSIFKKEKQQEQQQNGTGLEFRKSN